MKCRHCSESLEHVFLDLGFAPLSNDFLSRTDLYGPETWFPLKLYVCDSCWLVQTEDYLGAEKIFRSDYPYFSSTSATWLQHAKNYCEMAIAEFDLGPRSLVMEIASNDGYLLKHFLAAGVSCVGIEPTASTAAVAESHGIPVIRDFFRESLADQLLVNGMQADLLIGNNVLAHVPFINDFMAGMKKMLKPQGTITLEFPHLLSLIEGCQFDTVYHEHFSYLSLHAVQRILASAGLRVWKVEKLPTHGGSLRVYGCHTDDLRPDDVSVDDLLLLEAKSGICDIESYKSFQGRIENVKFDLLNFLIEQKRLGRRVGAYGAAAKGNTLLNFSGIRPDLLPYVCDAAPAKQGKFLPGSHIPVVRPELLHELHPEYLLVMPWNILEEVCEQNAFIREWGGRFVVAIPQLRIF